MAKWPVILLAGLGAYVVVLAVWSLGWHMYQDAPLMMYFAFLIDRKHLVPYRDFFDMNTPGAYAANVAIGRVFGYTEFGARCADLAALGVLLGLTYVLMRRFGRRVAWCAAILFGMLYLAAGEVMSLQREYLLLMPVTGALALLVTSQAVSQWKAGAMGLLVGVAATIKPQASLVLPVMLTYAWATVRRAHPGHRRWPLLVAALVGFTLPVVVMTGYLWRNGALANFADIVRNYWPLYGALSGARPHRVLAGAVRFWYVLGHDLTFGLHPGLPLLAAGSIGTFVAFRRSTLPAEARQVVWLLVGLAAAFTLYPAIGGKFWQYQWLPFDYVAILLGSLTLVETHAQTPLRRITLPAVFELMCLGLPWPPPSPFRPVAPTPFDMVREISTYLERHLAPGDTVAPLDWTRGAVHAMLLTQASPATPFLYDFHFYHHVSSPYIQRLRRTFVASLESTPPRFIIRIEQQEFTGPDTSQDFDELTAFISTRYDRVVAGDGYEIWQRQAATADRPDALIGAR